MAPVMSSWFGFMKKGSSSADTADAEKNEVPPPTPGHTFGNDISPGLSSFDTGSRSGESTQVRDLRCRVRAEALQDKQVRKGWTSGLPYEGVFIKKSKGNYECFPAELGIDDRSELYQAIAALNVRVFSPRTDISTDRC
jgi:hypothetical protein